LPPDRSMEGFEQWPRHFGDIISAMPNNSTKEQFFRMWSRPLFHMQEGKAFIEEHLSTPGVYVLYRTDEPCYIGKNNQPLFKRLKQYALKPNTRYYNFWNYFSAFEIDNESERDKIEAMLLFSHAHCE
jgi:hypothetical protein